MTRATRKALPAKPTSKGRPKPPAASASRPPADSLAEQVATDPATAVLAVLREDTGALTAGAVKQRLMASGVDKVAADQAWSRAQAKIRYDDHVIVENNTYRFTPTARAISAEEAVRRLSRGGDAHRRAELLAIIQSALESGTRDPGELAQARDKIAALERQLAALNAQQSVPLPPPPPAAEPDNGAHAQYERAERRRAARERQARIDAMAAVAELAAEVEELTAKRAAPDVLLEHTRALTGGSGLEAIGRAGEATPYDEARHDPVGDFPNEGDPVIVIRPGYLWHAPGEAVLISKALVTRA